MTKYAQVELLLLCILFAVNGKFTIRNFPQPNCGSCAAINKTKCANVRHKMLIIFLLQQINYAKCGHSQSEYKFETEEENVGEKGTKCANY